MAEAPRSSPVSPEEQSTQESSPNDSYVPRSTLRSSDEEPKSILELYTPKILTSMETVADEEAENVPETMCEIFSQSLVPFFLGGCGSISAGLLLTYANKTMTLVKEVPEFLVLMPPLQGLRGNLDMTFSSRMSTLAHKGEFNEPDIYLRVRKNAAVAQALSILICILTNLISYCIVQITPSLDNPTLANSTSLQSIHNDTYHYLDNKETALFLTGSSILSVALNCAICTTFLFTIVYCAWKNDYNPDNIVAPLGASISDMLTIGSMLFFCYLLRPYSGFSSSVPVVIVVVAACSIPLWIMIAWNDEDALRIAKQQCFTLAFAAMVSCGAGLLQSKGAMTYPNYPAYQTLISGLAGNRGAVLASRISSHLEVHKTSDLGWRQRASPISYYRSASSESRTARLLLFTALPFQMFFVGLSTAMSFVIDEPVETDFRFFIAYALVVLIQQSTILYLAQLIVFAFWSFGIDPDNHAIPLLTSAADVCGCGLLYLLFLSLDKGFR
ncbi:SLC41A/MgtE integral membrane domain-containing protein [Caenorhabditis elegans]|uniref:SLC41A/MgtE integral membrane domain-containing protein n=1 Tax=Caenorhabditis elegans TaxID=6239 RepID=O02340_CAEEL|nr:SLC41A/MgtE integral membrane domain-containing protein [Caenorhabditis elegans]CAB04979.2 SLC41A/MgtE integral membrane domain-containing protein [Caenorhabditis elegans]|eukprot:NP_493322.2 Uncharacterized protein CELE_ZK1053.6 [Caenorhabditis elegans]